MSQVYCTLRVAPSDEGVLGVASCSSTTPSSPPTSRPFWPTPA